MPKTPDASSTTEGLRSSVFEALARRIREHPGPLYPLHVGDTWREPYEGARAEAQTIEKHPLVHTYAHPHGEPAFVEAIAEHLSGRGGFEVGPPEVQVMSGATGGLSVVCQTLLDPGDEVLIPAPFWPLIPGIVSSRGAKPVQVPFFNRTEGDGLRAEELLEAAVTPRTAALYLNTPNNPTGRVLSEGEISAVARVAERHDLWVISDEAYEDIWFTESRPDPVWARDDFRTRTVATHTFSKGYGLAGARIGYTHGPADILARIRAVFTHQVYCASRPMQFGALAALREGEEWVRESRELYAAASRRCAEVLGIPAPEAGTFLFFPLARWLSEDDPVISFFERCMDEGVLLTPGAVSGSAYERWARVCFTSVSPEKLEEALERLTRALQL